ncbi:hypothetical protein JCM19000A_42690 [Silvimonas sp. JCM 19000]
MIAKVHFFGVEQGGRHNPPQTGFRPQLDIRGTHTSCVVESLDDETVFVFGKDHRISLKLMFPDQYPEPLKVGDVVKLYEGSKLIGEGEVVAL